MHPVIGIVLICACFLAMVMLIANLWKAICKDLSQPPTGEQEDLRVAERDLLEVSRNLVNLVTIPLIGLLQRCEALDEGRIADTERELQGLPRFVNVILGDYLDAVHKTSPLERLAALGHETSLLQFYLHGLLQENLRFCVVRMLLQIDEGRAALGPHGLRAETAVARARSIREAFLALEDNIYELASLVKAREISLRTGQPEDGPASDESI